MISLRQVMADRRRKWFRLADNARLRQDEAEIGGYLENTG